MTDKLKRLYEGKGALDRYFEEKIPRDIYRGRKQGAHTDVMQPTILGFYKRKVDVRPPDIFISDKMGTSPQFINGDEGKLVVDDKTGTLTADIIRDADKYMVRGCRTMKGNYRGVSLFHKTNPRLRNFDWFKIPKDTEIPKSLACTRDSYLTEAQINNRTEPAVHYTIAPKDDMPLSLFLQELKVLSSKAIKEK